MIKVTHLITGLSTGGAETMLYRLLSRCNGNEFEMEVISLTSLGPVGDKIRSLGIPVTALEIEHLITSPFPILKLARRWGKSPPNLIQTWMYHADLVGTLASAGRIPLVWGIHNSTLPSDGSSWQTRRVVDVCARLSRRAPVKIVSCSEAARKIHVARGYAADKFQMIPNGYDVDLFHPDALARADVRRELGISSDTILIGLVARFHPQKDHRNFVLASARFKSRPQIHFLLCGDGVVWENATLNELIRSVGLSDRYHLLGRREDLPRLTASLDVAVSSSSFGEAFSLVLGEAMACEVPCVATDVGDASFLMGDTGRVVPPKNPEALAAALEELIAMDASSRRELGIAARRRVQGNFNLPGVVARYEALYREVVGKRIK